MKTLVALLIFLALTFPQLAAAEDHWDFLHMTCSPELDYFALHMVHGIPRNIEELVSGKEKIETTLKRIQSRNGLYSPEELLKHPYKCVLPDHVIVVKLTDYTEAKPSGECGGVGHFNVNVSVDGEVKRQFQDYGINSCLNPTPHLIEVTQYQLRDCVISKAPHPDDHPACEELSIHK